MPDTHFVACPLCEATCGLEVVTDGPSVVSIRGDRDDPFSRGHICPKAVGLKDLQEDPDRLTTPIRREGTRWREIGWPDAFDEVTARLRAVQREHGRDAVAIYLGNPNVHSLGAMLFGPAFARSLRTKNRYSATSVDQLPHHLAAFLMFGHQLLLPIPDVERTQHLIVLGANPVVSNGSLMTLPDARRRLLAIGARGGRIVVIDPRRTETAAIADEHHFIRPGTDAALLLAWIHTIVAEGLERPGRLAAHTTGLDQVRAIAKEWPPDRASRVTGIDAGTIARLAREFARAERAVCYARLGVSTQAFGSICCWLVTVLNVLTGRLDEPGGAMFTRPALDLIGGGFVGRGSMGRWKSRVRGLPAFGGELPSAALAEEIDTPGAGQVRALVTVAGNPVLSTPNGGRLDRALPGLEFFAAIDFYVNETTRHAHVILPPAAPLERDHYDVVFNALAVRNVAKFSPAVFETSRDQRHDWQILNALTWRMNAHTPWSRLRASTRAAVLSRLTPRRLLDLGLRRGPYGAGLAPWGRGLRLKALLDASHGLDLGPLSPCLPDRLPRTHRKIDLAPAPLVADLRRLESVATGTPATDGSLSLIGRRDLRSNNSWMHNSDRLVKGPDRCTLLMHPADAAARDLRAGDRVRVRSRVGDVVVALSVTGEIAPGVVSLPHGWGHGRDGVRLRVATTRPGASLNDLTDEFALDACSGNAAFSGVQVSVTRE
jgi:anaerobic selenocysteine-containing dehydrogenase